MVRAKRMGLMKRSRSEQAFAVLNHLIMVFVVMICVYPVLHVLFASFSIPSLLMQHRGVLIRPLGFTLQGYGLVFANRSIMTGYINTIVYVSFGTALNLLLTSFGAYGLSRKNVMWRNLIMILIVFTMFFSGGLIPLFLLVRSLGLLNTRLAMILPTAISAWNLIVMRTVVSMTIPDSLEESAKIDGANDFVILFRIVLPLCTAVLAVMALFYGVGHWNQWFNAMLYLRSRALYPLQLILREILITRDLTAMPVDQFTAGREQYQELIKYSVIVVATVPIMCIYPFLQKYFVRGIMIGALKG